MKKVYYLLIASVALFLVVEVAGRWLGLTNYPLFVADPDYEYISAPNQDTRVLGKHFVTNQFSQRSSPVTASDTLVYLLIGDSVVWGGVTIDHDSLASTRLEKQLRSKTGNPVRVLNISAKSWGSDNAVAYLRKHGTFSADRIILVVSSHDAHDNMTHVPIVGIKDSHPAKNSLLAWSKIIEKVEPMISSKLGRNVSTIDVSGLTQSGPFNSGFEALRQLTDSLHIPFLIYLHQTTPELKRGQIEQGGTEIQAYCQRHQIPIIMGKETPDLYQDYIHLNDRGQKMLSDRLFAALHK
ncbi:hypothetical protein [Fibrella forsythiae]|uniref:SGNH hydrolase-type esterase domain-containing protein n=1 Tax=Fibrella forsythiae TaxID=2817061 RepID=A0ABS3JBY8_9BACT|nr:hypothetical protein [Fibrella forsythiae]MBO0947490.1 hypothetical protein [Fibrella forsythiae]